MIGKIMGALIGRSIDRRDGHGGLKGMALGVAVERVLKRLGPIGWIVGGLLWLVARLLFGRKRRYR
ncbi:hypothetical protein [Sphingomonas sp.]|uniref:hypothetical protein n=1 Tax=Sphingomonas sp. TaxID=28214 RepID=UPI001B14AAF0|nr:hypothetical protein [Sphingomonas sp.]MBO9714488.1 hypothetical protein [Sphingomonas sp.]